MVIVRLIGGLGNQMFQYALGRSLAERYSVPLKLDVNGYREYKLHGYALDRLKVEGAFADPGEVARIRATGIAGQAASVLGRLGLMPKRVNEAGFHFDPSILDVRPPVYLEGYWQSEKYFASVTARLREEFQLRDPMDVRNEVMAARIADCESVAVHVRRGDYVNNAETNAVHGTCGPEYYSAASDLIMRQVERPQAFVFSDDIGWARENLRLPFPATFVDLNGSDHNYVDLHLMARCRHQVIANSSFSWWAAWLNHNASKTVVRPRRWFRREDIDTRDLIPAGWLPA